MIVHETIENNHHRYRGNPASGGVQWRKQGSDRPPG